MAKIGWALAALCLIPGCGGGNDEASPRAAAEDDSDGARLEQAAQQAGLIEADSTPLGVYEQQHEAGTDKLCVVKGNKADYRFGLEVEFGEGVSCRGRGTARLANDRLILNFARSSCLIVADYQGDRIALSGAADVSCADLCTGRGSLDGVSFPRVSRDTDIAARARDSKGDPLCEK